MTRVASSVLSPACVRLLKSVVFAFRIPDGEGTKQSGRVMPLEDSVWGTVWGSEQPTSRSSAPPALQVADAETILDWSHGEVRLPETVHFRTMAPEPGGLFCNQIFGEKDTPAYEQNFGHLVLPAPILHPWFKQAVADRLDWSLESLDSAVAYHSAVVTSAACSLGPIGTLVSDEDRQAVPSDENHEEVLSAGAGLKWAGFALQELLTDVTIGQTPAKNLLLTTLPVLPAGLRPIVRLDDGRYATSDLNDLYRRVINRARRSQKLIELAAPDVILQNEFRMLQLSVEALFQNEQLSRPVLGADNKPLHSLNWFLNRRAENDEFNSQLIEAVIAGGELRASVEQQQRLAAWYQAAGISGPIF